MSDICEKAPGLQDGQHVYEIEEKCLHCGEMKPGKEKKEYDTTMWAWHDFEKNEYRHICDHRHHVEDCSSDSFKQDMSEGRGKIVRVKLKVVGTL